MTLKEQAREMIPGILKMSMPDGAMTEALRRVKFGTGRVVLIAVGKSAWQMASVAHAALGSTIDQGIVITKYGHGKGPLPNTVCFEAGHPIPDQNSFRATQAAMEAVAPLTARDTVLFLLSGGGSARFEKPLVPPEQLESITGQLLACGADIVEINTIRKRLSGVKGGRFAACCAPARVINLILSDVLDDRVDSIASGPTCADTTTSAQAEAIVEKYGLSLSDEARALIRTDPPGEIPPTETTIVGSVAMLCEAAASICRDLGYQTTVLTDHLDGEARQIGTMLANIGRYWSKKPGKHAFIAGGEPVVYLTGKGKGGRNQELALSAAAGIAGLSNTVLFSLGSDGTDGVTDAAGGIVDGSTARILAQKGIRIYDVLRDNDSYHALAQCDGLIITGATGTNVNDVVVLLTDNSQQSVTGNSEEPSTPSVGCAHERTAKGMGQNGKTL